MTSMDQMRRELERLDPETTSLILVTDEYAESFDLYSRFDRITTAKVLLRAADQILAKAEHDYQGDETSVEASADTGVRDTTDEEQPPKDLQERSEAADSVHPF